MSSEGKKVKVWLTRCSWGIRLFAHEPNFMSWGGWNSKETLQEQSLNLYWVKKAGLDQLLRDGECLELEVKVKTHWIGQRG
jgi:hypothetical protein